MFNRKPASVSEAKMTKIYEFQGKNVEQALEKAVAELNLPAEQIKHEVVAYGSSGIFGLVGVKKAKIKVFIEEGRQKSNRVKKEVAATASSAGSNESKGALADEPPSPPHDENIVQAGIHALQKIVDGITSGATVDVVRKKDRLLFSISGGESGVLIGKRGQTLEAMQYLLEKMINKKSTNRTRVMVDVGGYLDKRKNNLQQMASRMAEKAKRTQKPVTIGQMNAHDRRIIHIHLKDVRSVRTQSIGDGYYRKLMIFPKKKGEPKRRNADSKA